MFVIKSKKSCGAFISENSNKDSLLYEFIKVENAKLYTRNELKKLYLKYKDKWNNDEFEVFEVSYSLTRNYDWGLL